jgi:hypothetical protein
VEFSVDASVSATVLVGVPQQQRLVSGGVAQNTLSAVAASRAIFAWGCSQYNSALELL